MIPTFSGELMHFLDTTGQQFLENLTELLGFLRDNFGNFLWRLLGVVFIFFCAGLVMKWISKFTAHTMEKNRAILSVDQSRRVDTLMTLIRSAARYLVYFVAFLLVLGQFGGGMVQNVLVAVGRKVDHASINAVAAGLTSLEANDKMETSVPGIYSIGDANGKWMLAYTAMTMGEIAAANATGGNMTFDRKTVPSVIFLGPEFAGVGLTEDEDKAKGISYKVGKFSMAGNGRSLVMGQTDGMIKVIADTKYNEILGVHMVGPRACDMIAEASLALRLECTVDEWIDTVHAHPTVTEAMREAMLAVNKQCLHGANR